MIVIYMKGEGWKQVGPGISLGPIQIKVKGKKNDEGTCKEEKDTRFLKHR